MIRQLLGLNASTIGSQQYFLLNIGTYCFGFFLVVVTPHVPHTSFTERVIGASFYLFAAIGMLWIILESTVKRLHDLGRSHYWAVIVFIPYFCAALFIYLSLAQKQ